jgi:putative selenium metabolism protein SsnA
MILITNGQVVTRDVGNPFIADGAVLIDGNKIADVGESSLLKTRYPDAEYIDAKRRLVMPGLINCHQHYYSTFARGMDSKSKPATCVLEILKGLWWKLDKLLTPEDVYWSCVSPMIEEIRDGVTSVIDHHASPCAVRSSLESIAKAANEFGLRHNLCYETSDRDGSEIRDQGVAENVEFAELCERKGDDMIRGLIGMHAQMTISPETMDMCLDAAEKAGVGVHIHVAEAIEDVADAVNKYDMRVVERLYRRGALNKKSIAAHCIHITSDEIDMLRESGAAVVNNPESNMGNAAGVSPVLEMMKRGILVGMGTDGYTHDMTESFKVAGIIQKHTAGCPSVAWNEPPQMLFDNNPEIINRHIKGRVGQLVKNYYADVIIVDYNAPTPLNAETMNSHILFGISGRNVDTTICNGKILMNERHLMGIDEEALMAKSREHAEALWKRIS